MTEQRNESSAATVYCNGFPVTAGRDRGGWFCPHCLTRLSDPPGDHVAVPTDGHTSSAATDDDYEDDAELAEQLQAYFDRYSDLTEDEETYYRWLLYVVAGQ